MTRLTAPLTVDLELTTRCNLACRHCMAVQGQRPEMATPQVLDLLAELRRSGVYGLSITGGEPMLREDFAIILAHALDLGFHLQVSSNGTAVRPDWLKLLANPNLFLNFSLDGVDAETHDWIRGRPGAFAAVCDTLRTLLDSGAQIRVETVLMRPNLEQVPHIARLVATLGVKRYAINDLRIIGRAVKNSALRVSDRDFFGLVARLPDLAKETGLKIEMPRWVGEHTRSARDCSAAEAKCGIFCDGTVAPCLLFPPETGRKGLLTAWESPFFQQVAEAADQPGAACDSPCRARCGGGCRAAAYAFSGSVSAPDPSCRHIDL